MEDVLNQNESKNQERERHGIQDKVAPCRNKAKGIPQKRVKGDIRAARFTKQRGLSGDIREAGSL